MKINKLTLWMFAAILLCGFTFSSCKNNTKQAPQEEPVVEEETQPVEVAKPQTELTAINEYLVSQIGPMFAPAEVCIPCGDIIATDDSDSSDIRVWGDFWVFNCDIAGDTLKTVSGGSHPGLMHVSKDGNIYKVTDFEQVEDGAGNMESAQRIFGEHFDVFWKVNSDAEGREATRRNAIADYVSENNLQVTCYQDYGWDAVSLK
jgi:hypothetical protein